MSEFRNQVKMQLHSFRNSWVELGRLLNEVVYGGDYKEWGYDDFEVYCARELGLKKPTVQKLMISYNYMKKHQSKKLEKMESDESIIAPSPDMIVLLDKVRRLDQSSVDDIKEMHRQVFSKTGDEDCAAIRKALRQAMKSKPLTDPDLNEKRIILTTARKLRKAMSASHFVPDGLRERIEEPLVELEALDY